MAAIWTRCTVPTLDWKQLRGLASSKVYQLTSLFPIVGYLILFYPGLEKFTSTAVIDGFFFPLINPKYRLYLLYYGLFIIGISSILMLKIPSMFKAYQTSDEFADARILDADFRNRQFVMECEALSISISNKDHIERGEKLILANELSIVKTQQNPNLRQLYITYYNIHAFLDPRVRRFIVILFAVGIALLGMVSIDTLLAVTERLTLDVATVIVSGVKKAIDALRQIVPLEV